MSTVAEVIAVFGPTASGKSDVAAILARRLRTEVVSADALQVYRELPILSNHPGNPTRLVAVRSVSETMSVGEYAALAHAAIDELVSANGCAVVSGGTGLYLRAALVDLRIPPAVPGEVRRRWERAYATDPGAAFAELRRRDPGSAETIHRNDRRRVVRALELSDVGASLAPQHKRLWAGDPRRPTLVAGLDVPKAALESRIRERAESMFRSGVVAEVQAALAVGVSHTAEKALGLAEIATLAPEEAIDRLVVRTRRYAAYQRKWMRSIAGVHIVDGTRPPDAVAEEILRLCGRDAPRAPGAL